MEFHPHTQDTSIVSGEIWDARRRRGAVVSPMIEIPATMVCAGLLSVAMLAATTSSGCSWICGTDYGPPRKFCPFGEKTWL